jgi:hypothetical protein
MKSKILKALDFFRFLDETGTISLTNIALMVVITKLALTQSFSMSEAAVLLPVIASYSIKRWSQRTHRQKKDVSTIAIADADKMRIEALANDVERMKVSMGFKDVFNNR